MKSQRRHELQTNYLADHVGTAMKTSKPYAMWVVSAVAAVIVLAIGYGIYASQTAKSNALAWGDYYFNLGTNDAEVFQQVAEDHPNTAASAWAMQAWADNQLLLGLDQIYTDRKQAEGTLQNAIDAYQGILKSTYESELKNRAAMGLAQAYESLGKLDEAARYYQQVASSVQDGFAGMATQRLAWIKSGEGKAFYDWFASVRSTPAAPPALPSDLSQPPTSPDMSFPNKQNPLTLPNSGTTPPITDLPGLPESKPETPAGSTPPDGAAGLQLEPAAVSSPPAQPAAQPDAKPSAAAGDETAAPPAPASEEPSKPLELP